MSHPNQRTDNRTEDKSSKSDGDSAHEAAATMSEKLTEGARAAMHSVADAVEGRYEDLKNTARDSYKRGRKAARRYEASAEELIQQQPFKALLIAGGIGIVIGLLITRRR